MSYPSHPYVKPRCRKITHLAALPEDELSELWLRHLRRAWRESPNVGQRRLPNEASTLAENNLAHLAIRNREVEQVHGLDMDKNLDTGEQMRRWLEARQRTSYRISRGISFRRAKLPGDAWSLSAKPICRIGRTFRRPVARMVVLSSSMGFTFLKTREGVVFQRNESRFEEDSGVLAQTYSEEKWPAMMCTRRGEKCGG